MRLSRGATGIIFLLSFLTFTTGCSKNNLVKPDQSSDIINLSSTTAKDNNTSDLSFTKFKGLDMEKDTISIYFEGKDLKLSLPVYTKQNRYFLPLSEIVTKLNGEISLKSNTANIKAFDTSVILNGDDQTFTAKEKVYKLLRKPVISEGVVYASLFDIVKMFDLKTDWDYTSKSIALFKNREQLVAKEVTKSPKIALVRLEDIAASRTYRYVDAEKLYKLRIVADYLYSKGIPFHIAWVPRYIDSRETIKEDNEPAKQYSMYNSDFVYTLDYFADRKGIIGLHGYTHQYGNETSIDGFEFANPKNKAPRTDPYAQERVDLAKASANALSVSYGFFEAPHYAASPNQLKVFENNFDFVYEPYSPAGKKGGTYITNVKNGDRVSKYIPTPLDYIDGKGDTNNMIRKINNLPPDVMASFFYHPNIEFEDITVKKEADGYPSYTYSEESTLHRVVKAIEDKGYSFRSIYEIK